MKPFYEHVIEKLEVMTLLAEFAPMARRGNMTAQSSAVAMSWTRHMRASCGQRQKEASPGGSFVRIAVIWWQHVFADAMNGGLSKRFSSIRKLTTWPRKIP